MDFNFKYPAMDLQYLIHNSTNPENKEALRQFVVEHLMFTTYKTLVQRNVLQTNDQDLKYIVENKQKKLNELVNLKNTNVESLPHVKAIDIQIAELHAQSLDVEKTLECIKHILIDEPSFSLQMDIYLCRIRIGILTKNKKLVEENFTLADECCNLGCDWDRRNKFKIYKAIYNLKKSNFSATALLLSESLLSFEKNEMIDFKQAVEYLIFTGLLSFERNNIKKLLLECPEILEIGSKESVELVRSMYNCDYSRFLTNLCNYIITIEHDYYLHKYINFFCQEMKYKIYKQLLMGYQAIDLYNMANIFGISVDFLENDLCTFIVEKKLNCKIDKVSNTVIMSSETSDDYINILTEGRSLLNKIENHIK